MFFFVLFQRSLTLVVITVHFLKNDDEVLLYYNFVVETAGKGKILLT